MTAFPEITKESVDQCSAAYWYPLLSSCTFKSALIPLESDFIDYLGADGLILPLDDNGQPFPNNEFHKEEDTSDVDEDAADADDSSEVEEPIYPEFPDLLPKIKTTIQALGGSVFPKLNWSSPKDASWMALDGTLRCQTPHDILILLKSSDFIVHDLNQAYEFTSDSNTASDQSKFFLFLRKWYDLTPSMEFRCFVRDSSIVAICQRDTRNYYPFLASLESKATKMVQEFLNDKVLDKFSLTNCKQSALSIIVARVLLMRLKQLSWTCTSERIALMYGLLISIHFLQ